MATVRIFWGNVNPAVLQDVTLAGIDDSADVFGDFFVFTDQSVATNSIEDAEDAFGAPTLTLMLQFMTLAAIDDSADAFGELDLRHKILLTGIPKNNLFGALALTSGIILKGIPNTSPSDKFGRMTVKRIKTSGGFIGTILNSIFPGTKYGTKKTMPEDGQLIGIRVNSTETRSTISIRGGLYANIAGSPDLPGALLATTPVKSGVVTGFNDVFFTEAVPISSGTKIWLALQVQGGAFVWFLSISSNGSRYNADLFTDGISNPFGTSTAHNNVAPLILLYVEPDVSTDKYIELDGFASENEFGSMALLHVYEELDVTLEGIDDTADEFGAPTLTPVSVTIDFTGIDDTADEFGAMTLTQSFTIETAGFEDADAFGALTLEVIDPIAPFGIADEDAFGSLILQIQPPITPSPGLIIPLHEKGKRRVRIMDGWVSEGERRIVECPRVRVLSKRELEDA